MAQSSHQIIRSPSHQMGTAVLLSGGLDSAVLLADESEARDVQPVYVSAGLAWEHAERMMLERLLSSGRFHARLPPLVSLTVDMRDVYASSHWAVEGRPPAYHTPDEDVYLPGRNVILLAKAAVYCATAHLDRLVLGTLAHNPFPDATADFRLAMARALSIGLGHSLEIDAPYADRGKADVIRRGAELGVPFELSLSCMSPRGLTQGSDPGVRPLFTPQHCGTCSKCRERHDAFVAAGIPDPTAYADQRYVQA
ncbi:MAG: 7-cyano-7-deazaguanine synthase [Acidobacteria bacterium]|nr:MAG: 7-cyano-7-deazaguanine synthase [Acidobacteriota bacterium]